MLARERICNQKPGIMAGICILASNVADSNYQQLITWPNADQHQLDKQAFAQEQVIRGYFIA